jgi:hypothetical protein
VTSYEGGAREGSVEYRIGYYMRTPVRGRWWWGQFCPFIPAEDLEPLLTQASTEGTILKGDLAVGPGRVGT